MAVAVLGLGLFGCTTDAPEHATPSCGTVEPIGCTEADYAGSGPKVAVIGDSITHQSRFALHDALVGHAVRVSGLVGITTAEPGLVVTEFAESSPAVLVLNLGTNDITQGRSIDAALADYDAILARFPDACTVGVTITTHGSTEPTDPPGPEWSSALAEAFNAAIPARVDAVADWAGALDPAVDLTPGGIHPTEAGREHLAEVVSQAVDRCEHMD